MLITAPGESYVVSSPQVRAACPSAYPVSSAEFPLVRGPRLSSGDISSVCLACSASLSELRDGALWSGDEIQHNI